MVEPNATGTDSGQGQSDNAAQLAALQQQLQEAQSKLKTLGEEKDRLTDESVKLREQVLDPKYAEFLKMQESGEGGEGGESEEGEIIQESLDNLTPSQLVAFTDKRRASEFTRLQDDLTKRIDALQNYVGAIASQMDINLAVVKFPDFWDHKVEMIKVAKENPSWSAERCYKEVKRDLKEAAEEKAQVEETRRAREKQVQTEKGGIAAALAKQGKKLSKEEIASVIYDETVGARKGE